ncbi:hypothetical protein GPECTOR_27g678 [Gonium pectorale]|uniref:Uncharacterized protein n=1 Tax=Gonium pectorale TaxID=33097 RepID=A0A150GFB0_GONPE|nr:hypothetical protein GPECTOR_27g678 [Gonium pectorale]|eukprot:KXZ48508.1 hypothetical protein GPECTOR_27g678 [Gonium pectorale]
MPTAALAKRVSFESVWVVHNASDESRIKGPGGVFGPGGAQTDVGLPAINFLSNGASGPGSWKGEVADLRSALAAIGAGTACVAAISAELAFMPHYNMQRVLEHSYLRGRDVVGSSFLNGVDLAVLGDEGHAALTPAEDGPLPRIQGLELGSVGGPGMQVRGRLAAGRWWLGVGG